MSKIKKILAGVVLIFGLIILRIVDKIERLLKC